MSNEEDTSFLALPFDWYILENWNSSDPIEDSPQRREKHIELGIAYAALGHEGRWPYAQKAHDWRCGDTHGDSLPRSLTEVPRDLLNESERQFGFETFWIRTAYGPGTDSRFEELVNAHEDYDMIYFEIINDPKRYEFADDNVRAIFAFYPALLESAKSMDGIPFESDEVLEDLFWIPHHRSKGEENEDIDSWSQTDFFVADAEAMQTGFVRWVIPDQYGLPLLSERVQPWGLRDLKAVRPKRSLEEIRNEIAWNDYGDDPRTSDHIVGPWQPPSSLPFR